MYIDTNVQLAIAAARQVTTLRSFLLPPRRHVSGCVFNVIIAACQTDINVLCLQIRKAGKTVHIVVPDATEYRRSYKL